VLHEWRLQDVAEAFNVNHCVRLIWHQLAVSLEQLVLNHENAVEEVRVWSLNRRFRFVKPELGFNERVIHNKSVYYLAAVLKCLDLRVVRDARFKKQEVCKHNSPVDETAFV
jgi:hypothetical protein